MTEQEHSIGSGEQENESPFRVTVSPMVDGADPSKEDKWRPPARAINPRAELIERIHLYEGPVRTLTRADTEIQVQGFMDIHRTFFYDGETTSQPFIGWGLRDLSSYRGIQGYSDSGISCDPIYAYRFTKILEEFPSLNKELSDETIDDFVSVATSAERVWDKFEIDHFGKGELVRRRRKISSLIGHNNLRQVMQVLPPRLEEMMQAMYDKKRWVQTKNIERELRLKRLHPSEYFLDAIQAHDNAIADLTAGLEETGGVW